MPDAYRLLRPLLFALPAETAHGATLAGLDAAHRLGLLRARPAGGPTRCLGLELANGVGLAAGLDKNADHVDALGALGFGSIEVGTVTPRPQPGSPRPRLFRLPSAEALINRMGFNNKGVDHLVRQLERRRYTGRVGVNIGRNADTPPEQAVADYRTGLERAHGVADWITVNISSPNTTGLRDLQGADRVGRLLGELRETAEGLDGAGRRVPLVVKIAPDLDRDGVAAIAAGVREAGIDGVIATNTTIDRTSVRNLAHGEESGGLSGAPVAPAARQVLAWLAEELDGAADLIAAGGILDGEEAAARIDAGACLVQLYTGLIYRGPGLVREVAEAVAGR
ncbi:quinone-dependent dihydroorotate dehydrogenase [Thiohalospira sp.]|uniref:quinone-dependent dihydroorotate dehydrogenase n=1 Tax=Thiohalospira sp. TaxID=3080549 RepID=UPI003980A119